MSSSVLRSMLGMSISRTCCNIRVVSGSSWRVVPPAGVIAGSSRDGTGDLRDLMPPLVIKSVRDGRTNAGYRFDLYLELTEDGTLGTLRNTHFLRSKRHCRSCSLVRGGCCYAADIVLEMFLCLIMKPLRNILASPADAIRRHFG